MITWQLEQFFSQWSPYDLCNFTTSGADAAVLISLTFTNIVNTLFCFLCTVVMFTSTLCTYHVTQHHHSDCLKNSYMDQYEHFSISVLFYFDLDKSSNMTQWPQSMILYIIITSLYYTTVMTDDVNSILKLYW